MYLCLKTSPCPKPLIHMKMSLICFQMNPWSNTFSFEWFRTQTRFDTDAKENSKMSCPFYFNIATLMKSVHMRYFSRFLPGAISSRKVKFTITKCITMGHEGLVGCRNT